MSAETLQFKTELKQLLHLIIHSLYSHKDIFLRELISNASDAIDTLRFQGLTHQELLEGDANWKIKLIPNPDAGTLTVSDDGIGMSREGIVEHLGTIAKSGTRAFLEGLKDAQQRPELIGQFGVGFYSAFMAADKVTVESRTAGGKPEDGVRWQSDGQGEFTVEAITKPTRGTDVILHLRDDAKEFLDAWRLRQLVKQYSDFVEHPIVMDVEKTDDQKNKTVTEETLNSRKALWLRQKSEITPEEYNQFYRHVAHESSDPAKVIHYKAEGAVEFKALLYIPSHRLHDMPWHDTRKGVQLYIQRVFIMDDCEAMLPTYLRFVRGVVDSPDLPLNVSREILQQSAPLEKIKSNLTNKVLKTLEEWKNADYDGYVKFFQNMGSILKEGVSQDWSNREAIADLLLFESTKSTPGAYRTLAQYVADMPAEQKEIYYIIGERRELLERSPALEAFKARGHEVLLLTEPIDEFTVDALREFKGKTLKAADKGALPDTSVAEEKTKELQPLLDFMKERLPEVKEVRLSARLKESAAVLVTDEHAPSAFMERLMQRIDQGRDMPVSKRILEINADHAAVQAMRQLLDRDAKDARLEDYCHLLYDQAVIAEGSKVNDPVAFARRVNELMVKVAGQD
jgi:molecular chaperone HtpG